MVLIPGFLCLVAAVAVSRWTVARSDVPDRRTEAVRPEPRSASEPGGKDRSIAAGLASRWMVTRDSGEFIEVSPEELKDIMPGAVILTREEADALPDPADRPDPSR